MTSSKGETCLARLLEQMQPVLQEPVYVFVTLPEPANVAAGIEPLMLFREAEGVTLIIPKEQAEQQGWDYEFVSRMITLNIHSSLEAVGFLAAVTNRLAEAGMGVNPVSAFYHDHLFVPEDRALEAMKILQNVGNIRL
ncbi:hypothetical protein HMF8227_02182 [Saliniradius amylolyticus]|uniref:DUF2241 domain-containing protein n=1 Tax=Saliniradius amylolyticus TaxID=2183582 RepID=A0A2S2E5X6_9ALTE|nr:ACT domain-containing protein [Saliniradius amylolyticus]AWL12640.1 hypothetical protein HMF8227_02182 [Saliniradius amylolyticus]